jgi:hypothetical protein
MYVMDDMLLMYHYHIHYHIVVQITSSLLRQGTNQGYSTRFGFGITASWMTVLDDGIPSTTEIDSSLK